MLIVNRTRSRLLASLLLQSCYGSKGSGEVIALVGGAVHDTLCEYLFQSCEQVQLSLQDLLL